jgi:hypothetical protein
VFWLHVSCGGGAQGKTCCGGADGGCTANIEAMLEDDIVESGPNDPNKQLKDSAYST